MKPRQVLGKYFEVYGQADQITPEAGKKRAPFFFVIVWLEILSYIFIAQLSPPLEYFLGK